MKKLTKTQVLSKLKKLGEGETLTVNMLPSKTFMSGFKTWIQPYEVEMDQTFLNAKYPDNELTVFDSVVNEFSYYNCNAELGKRVHFYTKE